MSNYIIPARFFNGEYGQLREKDLEAWRSLVAHLSDKEKVVGSNPTVSTKIKSE